MLDPQPRSLVLAYIPEYGGGFRISREMNDSAYGAPEGGQSGEAVGIGVYNMR